MKTTTTLIALIGLLVTSTTLSAQTSVWKVTKDKRTVYLGGTCQMVRAGDFPLPKEFDQAFTAASQLIVETDFAKLQSAETQQLLNSRAAAAAGGTLDKVLSAGTWSDVKDFCGQAGIPEDSMGKVRAWRCRAMLNSVELQKVGATTKGIPAYFIQRTVGTQKKVGYLTPLEQHIDLLTKQGAGKENDLIEFTFKEIADYGPQHDALVAAWRTGNMAKVDEIQLKSLRQANAAIYDELITQRNAAWLPTIEAQFKDSDVEFILINVRSLAGNEGLLAQLSRRGYTVEQVKSASTVAKL